MKRIPVPISSYLGVSLNSLSSIAPDADIVNNSDNVARNENEHAHRPLLDLVCFSQAKLGPASRTIS